MIFKTYKIFSATDSVVVGVAVSILVLQTVYLFQATLTFLEDFRARSFSGISADVTTELSVSPATLGFSNSGKSECECECE